MGRITVISFFNRAVMYYDVSKGYVMDIVNSQVSYCNTGVCGGTVS